MFRGSRVCEVWMICVILLVLLPGALSAQVVLGVWNAAMNRTLQHLIDNQDGITGVMVASLLTLVNAAFAINPVLDAGATVSEIRTACALALSSQRQFYGWIVSHQQYIPAHWQAIGQFLYLGFGTDRNRIWNVEYPVALNLPEAQQQNPVQQQQQVGQLAAAAPQHITVASAQDTRKAKVATELTKHKALIADIRTNIGQEKCTAIARGMQTNNDGQVFTPSPGSLVNAVQAGLTHIYQAAARENLPDQTKAQLEKLCKSFDDVINCIRVLARALKGKATEAKDLADKVTQAATVHAMLTVVENYVNLQQHASDFRRDETHYTLFPVGSFGMFEDPKKPEGSALDMVLRVMLFNSISAGKEPSQKTALLLPAFKAFLPVKKSPVKVDASATKAKTNNKRKEDSEARKKYDKLKRDYDKLKKEFYEMRNNRDTRRDAGGYQNSRGGSSRYQGQYQRGQDGYSDYPRQGYAQNYPSMQYDPSRYNSNTSSSSSAYNSSRQQQRGNRQNGGRNG